MIALRRLNSERRFVGPLEDARKTRDAVLEHALDHEWLYDALEPHAEVMAFRMAGLQQWTVAVAIQAATCLNGIFEAWVEERNGDLADHFATYPWRVGPSLAAVNVAVQGMPNLSDWKADEISAVGYLRNAGAHPANRESSLKRAWDHDPNRRELDVYARALKSTAKLLDTSIGTGDLIGQVARMFVEGRSS